MHEGGNMKIREILQQLPQDSLEALARQRLSQVADIRLPPSVLSDELADTLTSFSYINAHVVVRHPPSFAIINLLLNAPEYSLPAENFRQRVYDETDRMIAAASRQPIFPKSKQYGLYMKLLAAAWEMERDINPSEANILRVLREELSISIMEHFVMEHHPDLHRYWKSDNGYEGERNSLLNDGILFACHDYYVLPEEAVVLIRRAWGFELSSAQYSRLLALLTNEDLKKILGHEGLPISGTAEEKKNRIYENYVSPRIALGALSMETLRFVTRSLLCRCAGQKDEIVEMIIDWLDCDEDLKAKIAQEQVQEKAPEVIKEPRELPPAAMMEILRNLTNDNLYDLISHIPGLQKSGNKDQRVNRLLESPYSERSLLSKLTNETLCDLSRQLRLNPYGAKDEKISRIIDAYKCFSSALASQLPPSSSKQEEGPSNQGQAIQSLPYDQLKLLSAVRADYPFLDDHEQVVLSYLLDFKSLTDSELEKLVQRFSLPWILPKAQMEELIEKMKTNGHDKIGIKAVGDNNIYQIRD